MYDVASVSNQAFLVLDTFIISHNAAGETFEGGGVSASTEKGKRQSDRCERCEAFS